MVTQVSGTRLTKKLFCYLTQTKKSSGPNYGKVHLPSQFMSIATSLQTRVEMVKKAFLMSFHTKASCGLWVMLLEASVPECTGLLLERSRFSEQY
jgi:hypothetical protein